MNEVSANQVGLWAREPLCPKYIALFQDFKIIRSPSMSYTMTDIALSIYICMIAIGCLALMATSIPSVLAVLRTFYNTIREEIAAEDEAKRIAREEVTRVEDEALATKAKESAERWRKGAEEKAALTVEFAKREAARVKQQRWLLWANVLQFRPKRPDSLGLTLEEQATTRDVDRFSGKRPLRSELLPENLEKVITKEGREFAQQLELPATLPPSYQEAGFKRIERQVSAPKYAATI